MCCLTICNQFCTNWFNHVPSYRKPEEIKSTRVFRPNLQDTNLVCSSGLNLHMLWMRHLALRLHMASRKPCYTFPNESPVECVQDRWSTLIGHCFQLGWGRLLCACKLLPWRTVWSAGTRDTDWINLKNAPSHCKMLKDNLCILYWPAHMCLNEIHPFSLALQYWVV